MTHRTVTVYSVATAVLLVGGNVLAWVESVSNNTGGPAAALAFLTALGLAIAGIAAKLITTVGGALNEVRKQREEIDKGSLSTQLDALKADTERLRESAHHTNNELQVERLARREESERLTKQLGILTEQLQATTAELHDARDDLNRANVELSALRDENRRLLSRVDHASRKAEVAAVKAEATAGRVEAAADKMDATGHRVETAAQRVSEALSPPGASPDAHPG